MNGSSDTHQRCPSSFLKGIVLLAAVVLLSLTSTQNNFLSAKSIMESENDVPQEKIPRYDANYSLCIICQSKTAEALVQKPTIPEKLLNRIRERAKYGDQNYPDISGRLRDITCEELESEAATWHRTCYQNTVHAGMCSRAKERFEKRFGANIGIQECSTSQSTSTATFTRSHSAPYNKDACFFCDNGDLYKNPLHKVATQNAGCSLKEAVKRSGNELFIVKLNTALCQDDAHAIDIKYHKNCWSKHVTNVIRKHQNPSKSNQRKVDEAAAEVEFLTLVEDELLQGKALSMSTLQGSYIEILSANNVKSPECSRKKLKLLLEGGITDVEFHKPRCVNQPERVTVKNTRDRAVQMIDTTNDDTDGEMKILYDAACILRKAMSNAERWTFTGTLTHSRRRMPQGSPGRGRRMPQGSRGGGRRLP